jgi:protein-S-isoprenylcysteine O-methyltransferase Ste14
MTPASLLKFSRVPPAWIAPAVLLAWVLDTYLPVYEWLPNPWNYTGAGLVWFLALVLTGAAARELASHKTSLYPNGESTALVTSGLYRYTRNPMYTGMALLVLGASALLGSVTALLGAVLFCVAIQHLFIFPEEQRMIGWFGDDYRAYCQRVRRWI